MEEIDDGEAARLVAGIAGRQVDEDVAIGRIALEIALERFAVHDDFFDRARARRAAPGRTRRAAAASATTLRVGNRHRAASNHRHDCHRQPSLQVHLSSRIAADSMPSRFWNLGCSMGSLYRCVHRQI